MKTKRTVKLISVLVALSMVICCMSFAFGNVSAVTIKDDASVSATAGSVVENDGFSWDNATVYFLLTDRFKNGNTSNDHSYGRGLDQNGNVVNVSDDRGTFHGGDFAGVTQAIEEGYFDDLGVNALWISAAYEQIHGYIVGGDSNPSFAHYSYHGYYVLDYSQTDANFGTEEEFKTLVDTAHEHGIRVVMDIVMNHSGYNSLYDMDEYGFGTVKEGWEDYYFSIANVNNKDYHSYIDYETSAEDWGKWWGPDWIRSGLAGYKPGGGDNYTMSLAGLPDFKTESTAEVDIPVFLANKWKAEGRYEQEVNELKSFLKANGLKMTVTNCISYWLSTWVREYGVDGFRCDTAKHVEYSSWKTLSDMCTEALNTWRKNNPTAPGADWTSDFWMTGEAWDHGVNYDGYYTQGGFDSMINFDTWGGGVLSLGTVSGKYSDYAAAVNTKDDFNILSFISSHDAMLTRGNSIYMGSAFLLLPGAVQIYYGDETDRELVSGIPFDGSGGAGHSLRSDMNWDTMNKATLAHWQKVGQFRKDHVAIGAGSNIKLSATNGVAFARTYDKNGVSDKAAAVIGASSNANVTIDVSSIWNDGQQLTNAYDQSSAIVTDGKVTFNSGANGTILIQSPDGRPLMSVTGEAKFKGTQTVTVSLEECDSATCSIDGGNKFVVTNGSTFEIGKTAYEGDTITITLEATNDKGSSKSVATFYKMFESEEEPTTGGQDTTVPASPAKLYVKSDNAPYVYAWTGTSTELCGAWPGKQMTEKNSEGYYIMDLGTTETFSVVLNNGSGSQSGDLTGLSGDTYLEVPSGNYSATKVISTINGGSDEPYEGQITITVKPYNNSANYNIYIWADDKKELAGAWPGTKLTEKDADGNYVYTVSGYEQVNAILNVSGQGQTSDITGIIDGSIIEITSEDCGSAKLTKPEVVLSKFQTLKKEAREVLAMTASDYTVSSWNNVQSVMTSANALIAQGEGVADEALVVSTLEELQNAKAALVLANAGLSYAVKGKSTIKGVAVQDADITVTVDGKTYKTTSDVITGEFTVEAAALTSSSVIKVDVKRNGLSSESYSYNMSNGDITTYIPPTNPTAPVFVLGDVTGNGKVSVDDATYIQKYIADLVSMTSQQQQAANVDGDNEISIKDATEIQKHVSGMSSVLG